MKKPLRLFVVDDHAIVRAGVCMLLDARDGFEVVGEADSGEEALRAAPELAPDVVVLDLSLPGINGIETARRLRTLLPGAHFVALSMHEDPAYVQGFLEAGGSGYVPKSSLETQLEDAILAVSRGEYYAPARLLAELARDMANGDPQRQARLTGRESEVVRQIAHGSTYREIAEALGISEKTVATYRERASEKLGVRTRADLVRWALRNGMLDD
ncbi:MAG: response regulator transcription factor [Trueperaceae bacterium]|nr:response regulator transcription factor [Trueperaceae bacterium]